MLTQRNCMVQRHKAEQCVQGHTHTGVRAHIRFLATSIMSVRIAGPRLRHSGAPE